MQRNAGSRFRHSRGVPDITPGNQATAADAIMDAIEEIGIVSPNPTDGEWLEEMTVRCAPLLDEWNVAEAWPGVP